MKNRGLILLVFLATFQEIIVKGDDGFISTKGVQFMLNGAPIYANGFNAYWLMYFASFPNERYKVSSVFQEASNYGLSIARTWAFSDGVDDRPLQKYPGSYDETMFQGLDFVVSEAKKYGIKLVMSLVNNYEEYGGKKKYVEWGKSRGEPVSSQDDFFTNSLVKEFYKNHIKTVLTRVNSITGIAYKDDPTIMAWELMNEPRCSSDVSGRILQNWIGEMATYLKSIDANHLLEIGLEGFYGASTPQRNQTNPNNMKEGTDFVANNQIPGIDFATVHSYPDQWLPGSSSSDQFAFLQQWVNQHIDDSQNILQKPVIFAEFGYNVSGHDPSDRDQYYRSIYTAIYSSASKGGSAAGGLFWQLLAEGMKNFGDDYAIVLKENPSIAGIISEESRKLSQLRKKKRSRLLLSM